MLHKCGKKLSCSSEIYVRLNAHCSRSNRHSGFGRGASRISVPLPELSDFRSYHAPNPECRLVLARVGHQLRATEPAPPFSLAAVEDIEVDLAIDALRKT